MAALSDLRKRKKRLDAKCSLLLFILSDTVLCFSEISNLIDTGRSPLIQAIFKVSRANSGNTNALLRINSTSVFGDT